MSEVEQRLAARRFDDREVVAVLDRLSLETLWSRLGDPIVVRRYAEPSGSWRQGDERPLLADDDPRVMQLIGMCAAARLRESWPGSPEFMTGERRIHAERCDWCEYPLEDLLRACDWAVYRSRYLRTELFVWHQEEGSTVTYAREGRAGVYEHPAWAAWFELPAKERAYRLERGTGLGLDR